MAAEDENEDFDTEIGGGKGEKGDADDKGRGRTRDSGDDEDDLEDLSREELYAKYREKNEEAKRFRLRLNRLRGRQSGQRDSRRESRRDDDDDRDDRDDNRGRGRDDRGRDSGRDTRREDRNRDRDDDRDSRESDRYRTELIESRAETELARAGIPADKVARAVRLIDIKNLELDGRDLIGIEDEIDDLKDEWPELFKRRSRDDDEDDDRDTRRRRIPRADVRSGGGRSSRDRKEKTATEIQAEALSAWASK